MLSRAQRPGGWVGPFPRHIFALPALAVLLAWTLPYSFWQVRVPNDASVAPKLAPQHGAVEASRSVAATPRLALAFEPVPGPAGAPAGFVARRPGSTFTFTASGVALSRDPGPHAQASSSANREAGAVSLGFVGASSSAHLIEGAPLPGKVNYLLGNDPARWRTNLPIFSGITYAGLYPGIDLSYTGASDMGAEGLKVAYAIAPGANPGLARWRYDGAAGVRMDPTGNMRVGVQGPNSEDPGPWALDFALPSAWQEVRGQRVAVGAAYSISPDGTVGFALESYDPTRPLTVEYTWTFTASNPGAGPETQSHTLEQAFSPGRYEPGSEGLELNIQNSASPALAYSTYLGGNQAEQGHGFAVDASGNMYVTGYTASPNFPVQGPFQPTLGGGADVFVTKLSPDGSTLVYSTYLGGASLDMGKAIALDAQGNVYVAGRTDSSNFPVRNPFQPTLRNFQDAFVAKLDPSGSALVYSTYLGGSVMGGNGGQEFAYGVAVDAQGSAYVAGVTYSSDFPTANAIQPAYAGGPNDGFVTKFSPSGQSLAYSTYLGGAAGFSGYDEARGIAVDGAGQAYVTGFTTSSDFPTANAIQPAYGGGEDDAFVTKINAAGSALIYSTYLGGNDTFGEFGHAIAADAQGNAYVTGQASSPDFPVANAFQPTLGGDLNAFVSKLNPGGSALVYSTYLGGTADANRGDVGFGIAVDAQGSAYVTGKTGASDFPTLNPIQPNLLGLTDGFLTKFNPSGQTLAYSTYLGGNGQDEAYAVAVLPGSACITGYTFSNNFPTVNPFQPALGGSFDAFVACIAHAPNATPTSSPSPTPPASNTPTLTHTATSTTTPTVTPRLVIHVTWQGIPQPNSRNTTETITTTLRPLGGGPGIEYGAVSTDQDGTYTLPLGTLPNGTYTIRAKGPRNLSNGPPTSPCGTVSLTGAPITSIDLGTMRAGDAVATGGTTNFNVVNSTDFTTLKATFGKAFGQPGYDPRADFNNTDNVDVTDFSLLNANFGSAGCADP